MKKLIFLITIILISFNTNTNASAISCPSFVKEGIEYYFNLGQEANLLATVIKYNSNTCWVLVKRRDKKIWINLNSVTYIKTK